ncbi:hypothetical protein LC653_21975 [Nostoc sp. CHAB 5784]|uniref:hypothetical protein n=1 Tax=Nostoc mirabile TaxID=2907820 RepID=UPI001E64F981|nr:hypothetical protein [Nostoc mirabile]MCC5666508.1 hypothetical protein [Nostoc mirabile CHAB5784]
MSRGTLVLGGLCLERNSPGVLGPIAYIVIYNLATLLFIKNLGLKPRRSTTAFGKIRVVEG